MALPGSKVLRRCQSKPVYLECLVTKVSAEMKEHKMYLKLENQTNKSTKTPKHSTKVAIYDNGATK